ncbi:MAG: murein biosynthesis integral membrane protein MurJ [Rhodospirillales bacterium]|nr:murein biosynthesis integral membrane protein MurJ [Rhodospirillales bacterium]
MGLMKSIATVGGMTMTSRVLGFVRDILVAASLGAGPIADAFFIAFKIPNLFRRLFAEGAFNAAFVPLFAGKLEKDGQGEAQAFANQAFAFLFWTLLGMLIIMELGMPWIMMGFAPGFMEDPEKFDLAVLFTRITFPYLLFISLVSLMGGILNSLGKFAAAAATPVLLNICLIAAILVVAPSLPSPGHALSWGVCIAGVIQFIWLAWHCHREGMLPSFGLPRLNKAVKTLIRRIIPGAIGAGIYQVNLVVDMIIASLLPTGSISYLFFADRVTQLPLGVVGVAVGTALLPLLSRQLRANDEAGASYSQNRALEFTLFLTIPAAVAFAIIPEPIIVTLFQRNEFTEVAASATAAALMVYAFGLPAYVLIKGLTPGFFARGDTKTPMYIAAVSMVVNVVFNLILMGPFLHVGLAMATVISAWTNTILLAVVLRKRNQLSLDQRFLSRLPRTLLASALMGGALWMTKIQLEGWLSGGQMERIYALIILIFTGLIVYFIAAQLVGAARLSDLKGMMKRKAT